MNQYKTPGVYIEEKDTFGSSIVANDTAVPVFIGFTEKANQLNGEPLAKVKGQEQVTMPILVDSQLTYREYFGGADKTGTMEVSTLGDSFDAKIKKNGDDYTPGYMSPSISSFFANGGGNCYIVSLGSYDDFKPGSPPDLDVIKQAIEYAETSTLVVISDLIRFGFEKYYAWCGQLLNFLEQSKRQFLIMDVIQNEENSLYDKKDIEDFRSSVSSDYVKYGAAYFPYLKSLTPYDYDIETTRFEGAPLSTLSLNGYAYQGQYPAEPSGPQVSAKYHNKDCIVTPILTIAKAGDGEENNIKVADNEITITVKGEYTKAALESDWKDRDGWQLEFKDNITEPGTDSENAAFSELDSWISNNDDTSFPLIVKRAGGLAVDINNVDVTIASGTFDMTESGGKLTITTEEQTAKELLAEINNASSTVKDNYQFSINPVFQGKVTDGMSIDLKRVAEPDNAKLNQITNFLGQNYINMPPSPFMAGIYSRIDSDSGVWAAPANTSPVGVTGPLVDLTNKQQADLNVDASTGKSVNAIRSFTGRGTLVWGARTSDGNSLDWRYINVRRLFIAMETDISQALTAFVFKPNVHNTWVEVKMMIDAYLFGLFQDGAFAGETPEQSYRVLIGEGETMTAQDVLNGYMKVSIQVAPVRPAEFIVLTFSQLMAEQQ